MKNGINAAVFRHAMGTGPQDDSIKPYTTSFFAEAVYQRSDRLNSFYMENSN